MSWDKNKIGRRDTEPGAYSCVPELVHDDRNAVSMVLSEDAPNRTSIFHDLRRRVLL